MPAYCLQRFPRLLLRAKVATNNSGAVSTERKRAEGKGQTNFCISHLSQHLNQGPGLQGDDCRFRIIRMSNGRNAILLYNHA